MNDVALTTPIQAHGETVSTLTFRPLTGKDLRTIGDPREYSVTSNGGQTFAFNGEKMGALMSSLAGIPLSSVDQLSAPDWDACMLMVTGFFGNGATPQA